MSFFEEYMNSKLKTFTTELASLTTQVSRHKTRMNELEYEVGKQNYQIGKINSELASQTKKSSSRDVHTLDSIGLGKGIVQILKIYKIDSLERLLSCTLADLYFLEYDELMNVLNQDNRLNTHNIKHIISVLAEKGLHLKPKRINWIN